MGTTQTPGRPKEHDADAVVSAATLAFWRNGYDGCSISDLLSATGLSKSSFYQSFGSKKDVFVMVLNHYSEREFVVLQDELVASRTGYEFFATLVEDFVSKGLPEWKSGCLIANTASEFGQTDPEVGIAIKQAIGRYVHIFASAVTKGHDDGSITSAQAPNDLANYLVIAFNGLRTMTKAGMGKPQLRSAGCIILSTLE